MCNGYTNVSNYEKVVNLKLILPSTLYTVVKNNVLTDYDYDFNVPLVMSSEGLLAPTLLYAIKENWNGGHCSGRLTASRLQVKLRSSLKLHTGSGPLAPVISSV